jgi:CDP-diacylglycerol--serine O-phosphatidyltransferase
MFAGFYGLMAAINGEFSVAAVAVLVAGVLDGLDGRVARLTNTTSEFGVQYDSLSDLVSFGVAPAVIVYTWALQSLAELGPPWDKLGWSAAFLYAACAALRLARFNTQASVADKRYFQGLASPAAAGTLVTMVWAAEASAIPVRSTPSLMIAVCVVTVLVALLMVSNVRYLSFKNWSGGYRMRFVQMLIVLLVFVLLSVDPPRVLFFIAVAYLVSGPLVTMVGLARHRARRQAGSTSAEES